MPVIKSPALGGTPGLTIQLQQLGEKLSYRSVGNVQYSVKLSRSFFPNSDRPGRGCRPPPSPTSASGSDHPVNYVNDTVGLLGEGLIMRDNNECLSPVPAQLLYEFVEISGIFAVQVS
jgi:hypothetical protein